MINIPEGTKEIGAYAFRYCSTLNQIDSPTSIKIIGKEAFDGYTSLQALTLPLISVIFENDCFKDAKFLTKVTFLSCPNKLEAEPLEGNTPLHLYVIKEYPKAFIDGIVKGCPNAIWQRNTLGQTPLHLCITNNVGAEVTKEKGEDKAIGDIIRAE
eukprot:12589541-Ditylum_brightwellii.AAC.1